MSKALQETDLEDEKKELISSEIGKFRKRAEADDFRKEKNRKKREELEKEKKDDVVPPVEDEVIEVKEDPEPESPTPKKEEKEKESSSSSSSRREKRERRRSKSPKKVCFIYRVYCSCLLTNTFWFTEVSITSSSQRTRRNQGA